MFNLENEIKNWKRGLRKNPAFEEGDIAELESHLREEVKLLKAEGISEEKAFQKASENIGKPEPIGDELYKTRVTKPNSDPPWKQKSWISSLLPNYIKVALRYAERNKGYVFMNVIGLAVGLACCIFIILYVQDELSFDKFFKDKEKIFRVIADRGKGDNISQSANTSYPIGPALKADFPEIQEMIRLRRMFKPIISSGDTKYREERFCVTDSTFFDVFDLPLAQGNRESVFSDPYSVVLTPRTARRYFGDENPIGQTMVYTSGGGGSGEFTVTGVLEELPQNTHLEFDFLAPMYAFGGPVGRWEVFVQNYTYLKLENNATPEQLEAKLPAFVQLHVGPQLEEGEVFDLFLQPLTSIHLYSHRENEQKENGNITYVYLFSAIGLLILLIACVNFMNMSTARSAERAQEVGMRKALGGTRSDLIKQFMLESVLMSLFALLLALILTQIFLPEFNRITEKSFTFGLISDFRLVLSLTGLALLVGLMAGSYPALLLSSFKPVQVLKSRSTAGGPGLLRKVLVVFQFAVTVALIIGTTVIYQQLVYTENKDLGFDKEQVVTIPIDIPTGNRSGLIKEELMRNSEVVNASASMLIPSEELWTYSARVVGQDAGITIGFCKVDYNFFETFGIQLKAGRLFNESIAADSVSTYIINEEAVRQLGFETAETALGKELIYGGDKRGTIIGVVRNFHTSSLHTEIGPAIFFIEPEYYYLSARLSGNRIDETMAYIESTLAGIAPALPFEYSFLDRRFDRLYRSDRKVAEVIASFSVLAIVIACFGLFGLTAYSAQQRTREIGVRKVLGATTANVFSLLTRDYLKLVVIGFMIAVPVSFWWVNRWLQNFAYHIEPGAKIYLAAGAITFLIALLTVSYQSVKTALMNPVKSLRSE